MTLLLFPLKPQQYPPLSPNMAQKSSPGRGGGDLSYIIHKCAVITQFTTQKYPCFTAFFVIYFYLL